ncbi:MAG TPA: MoxR family ATPase [Chloroflexia bacterium]|nr:MoxR family ATPase [Chloroflexia bacterium]
MQYPQPETQTPPTGGYTEAHDTQGPHNAARNTQHVPEEIAGGIQRLVSTLEEELAGVIVGQRSVVRGVLTALLAGGHVLLEGVPGLGKTLLVRTLAECTDLTYGRIQFTPDLMPADIVGTDVMKPGEDGRSFSFQEGPVFANLILADEINRATPRTQSAMLEAMQEHAVTVGRKTHPLPEPFFVLATQNPIDLQGTYPLPEAQLDRFFFKLIVGYPTPDELKEIARRTTGNASSERKVVMDGDTLQQLQRLVRDVPIAEPVLDYAARLVMATHPEGSAEFGVRSAESGNGNAQGNSKSALRTPNSEIARRYVRYGASPRAIQSLVLAGKVNAILSGRYNVSYDDLRRVLHPALRHRIVLNVEAQLQNVDADSILTQLMHEVRE